MGKILVANATVLVAISSPVANMSPVEPTTPQLACETIDIRGAY